MSAQQAVPFSSDTAKPSASPFNEKSAAPADFTFNPPPSRAKLAAKSAAQRTKPFLQALLYAPPPVLLELVQAMADDAATFAKLGLLSKKFGDRAGRFSDWCWLLSTLAGLVENAVERSVIVNLKDEGECMCRVFLLRMLIALQCKHACTPNPCPVPQTGPYPRLPNTTSASSAGWTSGTIG